MRSWYMLLFLHEGVAEEWLSVNDWANLRAWATTPISTRWSPSSSATARSPDAQLVPGQLLASSLVDPPSISAGHRTDHGGVERRRRRPHERQMEGSGNYVEAPWRYERIEGAGHWLQLEATEQVNRLLLDFLAD